MIGVSLTPNQVLVLEHVITISHGGTVKITLLGAAPKASPHAEEASLIFQIKPIERIYS